MNTVDVISTKNRWVSPLLALGVFIFPIGFFWFLLRTGYAGLSRVLGALWFILWIAILGGYHSSPRETPIPIKETTTTDTVPSSAATISTPRTDDPKSEISQTKKEPAPATSSSSWSYSEDVDQMRGTTTKYASITSDNSLYFDFPYSGGSTANLTIRHRPKDGLNIILQISKGQFICNSYSGDHVSVKFDKKAIQEFPCSNTNDGSSNVIFIENSQKFLSEIRKSSSMIIEASFYQAGNQQLKFSTVGLSWK